MRESGPSKIRSSLVQSVMTLDDHFDQLERLSQLIDSSKLKSDSEVTQLRKWLLRFAEHGNAISKEIVEFSNQLQDARARAESAAAVVSAKAELLQQRQELEQEKSAAFVALTEKVTRLNQSIKEMKPVDEPLNEEERSRMITRMAEVELQLQPLIDEAQMLRRDVHELKMNDLAAQADSLTQTLLNVGEKLATFTGSSQTRQ